MEKAIMIFRHPKSLMRKKFNPQCMLPAIKNQCWLCLIVFSCSEVKTPPFTRVVRDTNITVAFSGLPKYIE